MELDALCLVPPTFSPDGSKLAVCVSPVREAKHIDAEDTPGLRYGGPEIAVMSADGARFRVVSPNNNSSSWGTWFQWSPNSAHILCGYSDPDFAHAGQSGHAGYGIVSVQSGATEHSHYRENQERPMWDPNERAEVVLASPEKMAELWREAEAGGVVRNPDPFASREGDPFIAESRETRDPDTRYTVSRYNLWVRAPNGAKGALVMGEDQLSGVRVSPDRRLGVVQTRDGQLLLASAGGDLTPVRAGEIPLPDQCYLSLGMWRPDSKQFVFSTRPRESEPGDIVCRIWSFDILEDGREPPGGE